MLLRLAYLGITNAFTLLRLPPGGDRDKDIEVLSLRHQVAVLQRRLAGQQVRFEPVDRALLEALRHPLPRSTLRRLRRLVPPDTVLKWHRDLIARRHAAVSRPRRLVREATTCSEGDPQGRGWRAGPHRLFLPHVSFVVPELVALPLGAANLRHDRAVRMDGPLRSLDW